MAYGGGMQNVEDGFDEFSYLLLSGLKTEIPSSLLGSADFKSKSMDGLPAS